MWPVVVHSGASENLLNGTGLNRTSTLAHLVGYPVTGLAPSASLGAPGDPQPGSKCSPRGTSWGGGREDEGVGRRLLVVVGSTVSPVELLQGLARTPPAPLFLPPGPFSLSETQTES